MFFDIDKLMYVLQSTTMGGGNNYYSFLEIANNFECIDGTIMPSNYRYPTMNTFVPDMAKIVSSVASSPGILIMDGNDDNLLSWPLRSPTAICVDYYVCSVVQSYTHSVQINPFVNPSHISNQYYPPSFIILQLYAPNVQFNSTNTGIVSCKLSMYVKIPESEEQPYVSSSYTMAIHETDTMFALTFIKPVLEEDGYVWQRFDYLQVFIDGRIRLPCYASLTVIYPG